MMKKFLYILASFILGFVLILNVIYSNFHSTFQYLSASAVAEKTDEGYLKAEKFFSRGLDNNKYYAHTYEDGVHVEVFSALNDGVRYTTVSDETGTPTEKSYYTLESTIQFTLFHFTDTFVLADQKDEAGNVTQYGGVDLKVEGTDETLFFPFYTRGMDNYALVSNYSFLVLTVNYDDYVAKLTELGLPADTQILSAVVYDSQKDNVYEIVFDENHLPSFDTTFHNAYKPVLDQYNAHQLKAAQGETVDSEAANKITAQYQEVTAQHGFEQQHGVGIIYGSFKFLFPVISSALGFLGVDILLGYLIFRKKKQRTVYTPTRKQITEVKKRPEPEQFTRNVFNAEEDDVVETKPSEEV